MAKKILIVEDDMNIRELLRLYLEREGYETISAGDGGEGLRAFRRESPDLVLLDIMMPVMDGWQVCRAIRAESKCPVIMLTAKGETFDKVSGLDMGADDYIVKPFDLSEFLARVEAVLRRYHKKDRFLCAGSVVIDTESRTVTRDGAEVSLTLKEYEMLLLFVRNPGVALYRETIYERVWDEPYYGDTRTVDLHVQRLRKKLNLSDEIQSVYKIGYRFKADDL